MTLTKTHKENLYHISLQTGSGQHYRERHAFIETEEEDYVDMVSSIFDEVVDYGEYYTIEGIDAIYETTGEEAEMTEAEKVKKAEMNVIWRATIQHLSVWQEEDEEESSA